ncbi:hypothetical protein HOD38_03625 [archaeon]|jgi:dienelactone hydrolase|nr:hypothetical protein [archaeon]MBT4397330.1 hypothetical protein [archaeon]MBT4440710.1 hypothetical protein [archaeon]
MEAVTVSRQGRVPIYPHPQTFEQAMRVEVKSKPIELGIEVYPSTTGKVVIHQPGFYEKLQGYKNKYRTLARLIQERFGAAILMDNEERDYHPFHETATDDLLAVINFVVEHSREITGAEEPEICLMGFSAGGTSVGSIAGHHPLVEKVLLIGPSHAYEAYRGRDAIFESFERFEGEVFITQGDRDGSTDGTYINQIARHLGTNSTFALVPGCDHDFRGARNDFIYSKTPFWAFAGDSTFPSPEGGVRLVQK